VLHAPLSLSLFVLILDASNSLVLTLSAAQQVNELEGDDGKKRNWTRGNMAQRPGSKPPHKKRKKKKNLDEKKGGKIKISKKEKERTKNGVPYPSLPRV
jgi:hypothetical protein